MKKLLTLVALTVLLGINAFAQTSGVSSTTLKVGAHDKFPLAKNITAQHTMAPGDTIEYTNLIGCDSFIWGYSFDAVNPIDSGWVNGNNFLLDAGIADFYRFGDFSITGKFLGWDAALFQANSSNTTSTVTFTVWAADGPGGSPGTVLATQNAKINTLTAGAFNVVWLATPLTIPGNIYVGAQLTYKNNKFNKFPSVATYQSGFGFFPGVDDGCVHDSAQGTAWVLNGGTWSNYRNYWGGNASLAVNAIIAPPHGCSITVTPPSASVCSKKPITLTASGATTYTWAPSTGLNVTTGAVVTAKPKSTTTYTVTGDGGSCSKTVVVTVKTTPKVTLSAAACTSHHVVLTATANPSTGENYKWKLGSSTISGATNSTYTATVSGSYKVIVTLASTGCSVTSKAANVTICKLDNITSKSFDVSAYPNPFTNSLSVTIGGASDNVTVTLLDFSGRVVKTYENVDPSSPFEINEDLAQGVYFVKVNAGPNSKMVKVVKE